MKIENEDEQQEILSKIVSERLNVRDTDALINSYINGSTFVPVNNLSSQSKEEVNETSNIDFNTFFKPNEEENEETDEEILSIEDKVYPAIEDKVYTPIETTTSKLLGSSSNNYKDIINKKIKDFVESLREEGIIVNYDSYEFDKLYEFIIKIDKE